MGLDMFAYSVPILVAGTLQTDIDYDPENCTEIARWRKFNALHGWMQRLYYDKNGTSSVFNCNTVRLETADLDRLESEAEAKILKPAAGFFFGSSAPFDDDDCQRVLEFVRAAKMAIADGRVVVYDSWW